MLWSSTIFKARNPEHFKYAQACGRGSKRTQVDCSFDTSFLSLAVRSLNRLPHNGVCGRHATVAVAEYDDLLACVKMGLHCRFHGLNVVCECCLGDSIPPASARKLRSHDGIAGLLEKGDELDVSATACAKPHIPERRLAFPSWSWSADMRGVVLEAADRRGCFVC